MSISVYGILYFVEQKVSIFKRMELAFYVQHVANECRIGINMDANVSAATLSIFLKNQNTNGIFFELTDSPIDNYVESLFQVDGCINYINGERSEKYERLQERMSRMQLFLSRVLQTSEFLSLDLVVNHLEGPIENDNMIHVEDFQKTILNYYEKQPFQVPILHFQIIE